MLSVFEARDLFSVLEDWGYEVCPFDPGELSPSELEEVLALREAAAELLREGSDMLGSGGV